MWAVYTLFASCTLNSLSMEAVVRAEPLCGRAMTFWQFAAICAVTAPLVLGRQRRVPLVMHLCAGALFCAACTLNNAAFAYGVSVPLHMLVRSAQIAATLLVQYAVRGRLCSRRKLVAGAFVTAGMLCCMDWRHADGAWDGPLMGNAMLVVALFLQAALGLLQEKISVRHGYNNTLESAFYMHSVALVLFWAFRGAPPLPATLSAPSVWPVFAFNTAAHVCCTLSGFRLFAHYDGAVNGALLITLRKGVSLVLSAALFGTRLEWRHWLGAAALLIGTLNYAYACKV